jgi:hypothetical protein
MAIGRHMMTHALVGRDAELKVLTDMVSRARDHGGAIFVLGEPGVGKSSLLQATADRSRSSGLQVLSKPRLSCRSPGCTSSSGPCLTRSISFRLFSVRRSGPRSAGRPQHRRNDS